MVEELRHGGGAAPLVSCAPVSCTLLSCALVEELRPGELAMVEELRPGELRHGGGAELRPGELAMVEELSCALVSWPWWRS